MGRKRTHLTTPPAEQTELAHRLRTAADLRQQERLRFVLLAAERHTLEDLAARLGCARSTLQLWLDRIAAADLAGVLERESPLGLLSPMATAAMQSELQAGLQAVRWRAAAIANWLQTAHGLTRARKSIHYWLGRNGWAAPGAELAARHRKVAGVQSHSAPCS